MCEFVAALKTAELAPGRLELGMAFRPEAGLSFSSASAIYSATEDAMPPHSVCSSGYGDLDFQSFSRQKTWCRRLPYPCLDRWTSMIGLPCLHFQPENGLHCHLLDAGTLVAVALAHRKYDIGISRAFSFCYLLLI